MHPDKFTMKTQAALQAAQSIAHQNQHQEIGGEHLVLALLQQEESLIPPLLQQLGVAIPAFASDINRELGRRAKVQGTSSRETFMGKELGRALDAAEAEAEKLKDEYVS